MRNTSKIRNAVLAAALAAAGFALAACGTSSTGTTSEPSTSQATVTATITATPAPAVTTPSAPAPATTAPAAPAALPVINPVCLSGSELYLTAAEKLVSAQTMWMIIPSQESVTAHNTAATTFNTTREQLAVVIQSDPLCDRLTDDFNAVQASLAVLQAQGADVAMPDRTSAVSTFRTAVADYRADVAVLSA